MFHEHQIRCRKTGILVIQLERVTKIVYLKLSIHLKPACSCQWSQVTHIVKHFVLLACNFPTVRLFWIRVILQVLFQIGSIGSNHKSLTRI